MTNFCDGKTAQLLDVVSQNMPKMTGEEMQRWIDAPNDVAEVLTRAFNVPKLGRDKKIETLLARQERFDPEKFFPQPL